MHTSQLNITAYLLLISISEIYVGAAYVKYSILVHTHIAPSKYHCLFENEVELRICRDQMWIFLHVLKNFLVVVHKLGENYSLIRFHGNVNSFMSKSTPYFR